MFWRTIASPFALLLPRPSLHLHCAADGFQTHGHFLLAGMCAMRPNRAVHHIYAAALHMREQHQGHDTLA